MTYNYPKTNENNEQYFNSPPLEYKTSTFPTNIKPPPFPNEVHDNEKKSTYVIPLTKKRMLSCLSFKYWTPYFDLSTKEFGKRVLAALIPCTGDSFFILLQGKPDLYAPFWIYSTLIFCLAAAGNLHTYFLNTSNANFTYNFSYIPSAFFIVFSYGFLAPLCMTFLLRLFEVASTAQKTYVESLCLYGYSTFIFLPISLLCMIPSTVLEWVFMGLGMCHSTFFLVYNYWKELRAIRNNNKWVILNLLILGQIALYILFEVYFFSSVMTVTVSSSGTSSDSTVIASSALQTSAHMTNYLQESIHQKLSLMYRCSNK